MGSSSSWQRPPTAGIEPPSPVGPSGVIAEHWRRQLPLRRTRVTRSLNGGARTIPGVEERLDLQQNGFWRIAVWALRVGYVGLAIALAGLIALAFGSTPWVVASGVIIWLATVPVTLTGFLSARHGLAEPRPRLWSMRLMLIHDSVHHV